MYMVYGKHKPSMRRFSPINMKHMQFVSNKIHASVFYENELQELEEYIEQLQGLNPECVFEIREIS